MREKGHVCLCVFQRNQVFKVWLVLKYVLAFSTRLIICLLNKSTQFCVFLLQLVLMTGTFLNVNAENFENTRINHTRRRACYGPIRTTMTVVSFIFLTWMVKTTPANIDLLILFLPLSSSVRLCATVELFRHQEPVEHKTTWILFPTEKQLQVSNWWYDKRQDHKR